jgi:hypothetical protein
MIEKINFKPNIQNDKYKIIALLILIILISYVWIKLYIPHYKNDNLQMIMDASVQLKMLQQEHYHGVIVQKLLEEAEEHDIPIKKENITITYDETESAFTVGAKYEIPVRLFCIYTHRFDFFPNATAPKIDYLE